MGKGFWDVLKPVARMESLDSLRGKVLAIDLSFWMIQLLTRVKGIPLRKPHIRLLFFRTIHLVAKIGAFPVFVADGEPPPLKLQVRLVRFSRISGLPLNTSVGGSDCNVARSSLFTDSIDECVELLELLGMPVLRAKHEAEGLCAELERQGLVNACVTPDSDAFLYGAKHVIKILQADLKDPHVESYMMSDVESFLGLHREHLVALALLAGCDYNVHGVSGIGCQNAVRLIKVVPKDQIFERLRAWGTGKFESRPEIRGLSDGFTDIDECEIEAGDLKERENVGVKKEYHCSCCGHPGTKKLHTKLGCEECRLDDGSTNCVDEQGCRPKVQGFKCTCDYCTRKEVMKKHTKQKGWQLKICQRISEAQGFPNEEIIQIFMNPEQDTLGGDSSVKPALAWKPPRLEALERFLEDHLHWEKAYVRQKVLPLLSFYCLRDTAAMKSLATSGLVMSSINGLYTPHSIQRIKILFSKRLYRLRWIQSAAAKTEEDWLGLKSLRSSKEKKIHDELNEMVSDLQTESLDNSLLFTTDEDMMLVKEACPDLVSQFEWEQVSRKNVKKGISRRKKNVDNPSKQQLRITSFFKSRKGGVTTHDTNATDTTMEGSTLSKKTQAAFLEDANMNERAARPQVVEKGVVTVDRKSTMTNQDSATCKTIEATQAVLIGVDDFEDKLGGEDPVAGRGGVCSKDPVTSSMVQTSGSKLQAPLVLIDEDIEAAVEEDALLYPCKARKLGESSPGSQTNRGGFSPYSRSPSKKQTPRCMVLDVIHVDATPPCTCLRDPHLEEDEMVASDSSSRKIHKRSPQVSARRVLF